KDSGRLPRTGTAPSDWPGGSPARPPLTRPASAVPEAPGRGERAAEPGPPTAARPRMRRSARRAFAACPASASPYRTRPTGRRLLLGLPEDLGDLVDLLQQLLGHLRVGAALGARGPRELRRLVDERVQLRVLLEVRRLEVVRPQHPEVFLHQLGALLLDDERARAELRVLVGLVLLADRLDRLRLDARLGRVVDPARQVAVSRSRGLRQQPLDQTLEQCPSSFFPVGVIPMPTLPLTAPIAWVPLELETQHETFEQP